MNIPHVKRSLFHADAHLGAYQDDRRKKLYKAVASELERQAGPDTIEVIIGTIIEDAILYFNPDKRPELRDMSNYGVRADTYFRQRVLHNVGVLQCVAEYLADNND